MIQIPVMLEQQLLIAMSLCVICVISTSISLFCLRSLLRKRGREEDPSLELDSKRPKLDDETTSSSNQVAQELVPEPEAPLFIDPESPNYEDFPPLVELNPDLGLDVHDFLYREFFSQIWEHRSN